MKREVVTRQGWKLAERGEDADGKPALLSEKTAELWERESTVGVGVGPHVLYLSVDGARRLARLLLDLALRVERRVKAEPTSPEYQMPPEPKK